MADEPKTILDLSQDARILGGRFFINNASLEPPEGQRLSDRALAALKELIEFGYVVETGTGYLRVNRTDDIRELLLPAMFPMLEPLA